MFFKLILFMGIITVLGALSKILTFFEFPTDLYVTYLLWIITMSIFFVILPNKKTAFD